MVQRALRSGLGLSPVTACLAVLSVAVALLVGILTALDGRVPWFAPLAVIVALMVSVLAATDASRPDRADRDHPPTDNRDDRDGSVTFR